MLLDFVVADDAVDHLDEVLVLQEIQLKQENALDVDVLVLHIDIFRKLNLHRLIYWDQPLHIQSLVNFLIGHLQRIE